MSEAQIYLSEQLLSAIPELTPYEPEAVQQMSRYILRDFYQTFRLSQGDTAPQEALFWMLGVKHRETDEYPHLLQRAVDLAEPYVTRLRPPAKHTEISLQETQNDPNGFLGMWPLYAGYLLDVKGDEWMRPIELVADDMLAIDVMYQGETRPGRRQGEDPHESIVREYILGDRLSGSAQLIGIRNQFRSTILDPPDTINGTWLAVRLQQLRSEWERNHPGEDFFGE